MNWQSKVTQSILVGFQSRAFRGELAGFPSGFFGRHQKWLFHLLQQVFLFLRQQSSPRPSRCHHHASLLFIKCCALFMLFLLDAHHQLNFRLFSPRNVFPKVLRIIRRQPLVLFDSRCFGLGTHMDAISGQCLFYGRVINTELHWGQQGLRFFGCSSKFYCDLLDELALHS